MHMYIHIKEFYCLRGSAMLTFPTYSAINVPIASYINSEVPNTQ